MPEDRQSRTAHAPVTSVTSAPSEMGANAPEVLVSVIVPVYNTDAYLAETLDSILGQSLGALEVVCVDDGSTDGSAEVLETYRRSDERVVVVRQDNAGQSAARNVALARVRGAYTYFLDSDDVLEPGALQTMHEAAVRDALDVLCFDGGCLFESDEFAEKYRDYAEYYVRSAGYAGVYSGSDLFVEMTRNRDYRPNVFLQLYRTSFLRHNDIAFREGILHEDNLFTFQCLVKAQRVAFLPSVLARRRFRAHSVMTSPKGPKHAVGAVVAAGEMFEFAVREDLEPEVREAAIVHVAGMYRRALPVFTALPVPERNAIEWPMGSAASLFSRMMLTHVRDVRDRERQLGEAKVTLREANKEIARLKAAAQEIERQKAQRLGQRVRNRIRRLFGRSDRGGRIG